MRLQKQMLKRELDERHLYFNRLMETPHWNIANKMKKNNNQNYDHDPLRLALCGLLEKLVHVQ